MKKTVNVAIDGPAGAGKSSVAKKVAERLRFLYIDTGAMYRALTYAAIKKNLDLHDGEALADLLSESELSLVPSPEQTVVYWDGSEVTDDIRTNRVNAQVSLVSSHQAVREAMVGRQQALAAGKDAVLEGRDIGTHVLPQADVKVFLTASVEERARRRHLEQQEKGFPSHFEQLKQEIAKRDELDSTRTHSPLKKAEDATVIDTTAMGMDEVITAIYLLVKEKLAQ
ncbi:(d)CMP kinase [Shouchella lonarensis]|uniref:Cytidylate kinase n=1 Tax=Shouchella lonarensis TaxID=1464122 RepID=A0A1G6J0V6_9BACI|nr:(d)CMP kinase [Shouchella lonarensis]SDC12203.1 cytidylate kinase [Shouchella lonarensis]